ncbi:MAG: GNAT family N-acetyltransferase [Planctomycetes bacterium]|nr:GNAT family N-acetyltransferase [Planctomycetota bacterium]
MTTIRLFEREDEGAFLSLHNRAFEARWSRTRWRWRFTSSPLGRTDLLGAFTTEGRCVASYGGVALPFSLDGRRVIAIQHGDVAIDPDLRAGLGGSRLLVEISRAYFEHCSRSAALMWGFPQPPLLRVLTRFAQVEVLRDVVFLLRPTTAGPPESTDDVVVERLDRCGPEVDALWRSCASQHPTAVVRDADYLSWRYLLHPEVGYRLLAARDAGSGALRGLAVTRPGGWSTALLSLCDWLVPADDRQAERALIGGAVAQARAGGLDYVAAWFPHSMTWFHRFQVEYGFFAHGLSYQQVARTWIGGYPRPWLHEHWYQTMGDMDFF